MTTNPYSQTVLIATYLEPEHVAQIRAVSPDVRVIYEPSLLPPPRYPADHTSIIVRTAEQETQWRALLAEATILFDFDHTHRQDLPELAPQVRWLQASSAGIGQFVRRMGYDRRMPQTTFTTASGVHTQPLAEFCALAMLSHSRNLPRMIADQQRHYWERNAGSDLSGRTLLVIGAGKIGCAVAAIARVFGMTTIGIKRTLSDTDTAKQSFDELYTPASLHDLLPRAEYLVLVAPHTDETEGLIGAHELALLPAGAYLINIGRGACIDEPALIAALQRGHLGGAALDVFAEEPLPPENPLWAMPNVMVSPHSASTSDRENARLTDLFCTNLRRYLAHEPLLNVLNTERLY